LPAAVAALVGATALVGFAGLEPLASYEAFGRVFEVTPVKLVIGTLIVCFAAPELSHAFAALTIPSKLLGTRLLAKVTLRAVQITVAVCMVGVGAGLATGLI
jgi:hypothetical protein